MASAPPDSLGQLLQALEPAPGETELSLGTLLSRIGADSFAPMILLPALILVSPVSGVPGTPTIGAVLVVAIAVQAVFGRAHLRLPGFVTRRALSAKGLHRALDWLRRPAAWIDRHSRRRLSLLTGTPFRQLAYVTIAGTALTWPFLELLPFVTSFGAGAVSLISFGLMTRDGVWLLAGYAVLAGLVVGAVNVAIGLF